MLLNGTAVTEAIDLGLFWSYIPERADRGRPEESRF